MTEDDPATRTSDAELSSDDTGRPEDAETPRTDAGETDNGDTGSVAAGSSDESGPDGEATGSDEAESDAEEAKASGGPDTSGRDVVVPMRVYKAVTVFTTLFAVASVLTGFVFLDMATNRGRAALAEIDVLLALVGVGLIVAGAAAYAFSTRFRTDEMGKSKDDTDEGSDDG